MRIKNATVFTQDGRFEKKDIIIENKRIIAVVDPPSVVGCKTADEDTVIDASGCYAIPGLTDMHFHGCMGHDFCEGTSEAIEQIAAYEVSQGITAICPATMTLSQERLLQICENAAAFNRSRCVDRNAFFPGQTSEHESSAADARPMADLVGINLEGPFISLEKKGAQNPKYIRTPDIEEFRKLHAASEGLVKTIAIAPETDNAMAFIDALKGDTVISIAHTAADYDTANEALDRGARHVTHLYNAMPPLSHRAPGVIGAAADHENCHVELICDGIHIHPSTVRTTFKIFGDDRIILISDSMEATGMPDGQYSLGGLPVTVRGTLATLADGTIAGSATNLMDCLRVAVKTMGIPLESAVKCAAVNPAREIGIDNDYGAIAPGKFANIVLLDKDLNTQAVIFKGRQI